MSARSIPEMAHPKQRPVEWWLKPHLCNRHGTVSTSSDTPSRASPAAKPTQKNASNPTTNSNKTVSSSTFRARPLQAQAPLQRGVELSTMDMFILIAVLLILILIKLFTM